MNKNYYLLSCLFLAASLFFGCSKEELKLNDLQENSNSLSNRISLLSAADGKNDLLGFGYDITGEYANSSAAKFPVIDVDRLQSEQPTRVVWDLSKKQEGKIIAGKNALDYTKGLSLRVDAEYTGVTPFFKATVTARYKDSTAFSSKFVYSSFDLMIIQKRVKFNANNAMLMDYLSPSFIADVSNQSAAYIVNNYGTHILKDIVLGAKLEVLYRSETSREDKIHAASAGVDVKVKAIFSINTGYSYNTTDVKDNFSQSLHYRTWGGNPSTQIIGEVPIGTNTPVVNIGSWQNSSTVDNAEMINISEGGLIPIYDVINDPVKKAEVRAYVTKYLSDNQIHIVNEPPTRMIYRCYNASTNGRLLTANPGEVAGSSSWQVEGPFAKIYPDNSITGTIALHRFYLPNTKTHVYSNKRDELGPANGNGVYEGIVGYIFSADVPGTQPLIRYVDNRGRHMFSVGFNELGWGTGGWMYESILGYVKGA